MHFKSLAASLLLVALLCSPAKSQPEDTVQHGPGPLNFNQTPQSHDEARFQLTQLVERDYEYWAGSRDRALTVEALGKLERNHKIKGGQAAAIGVLGLCFNHGHGRVKKFNFDQVMRMAQGEELEFESDDLKESKPIKIGNMVYEYKAAMANIQSNVTENGFKLWGPTGGPSVVNVKQGQVGDCYWISAVEAVVLSQPDKLQRCIRQVGANEYQVFLPGANKVFDFHPTQAEMAQNNLDPGGGCWLTLLSLGEARVRDSAKKLAKFWTETPEGVIAHAGSQNRALSLLTGERYKSVSLHKHSAEKLRFAVEKALNRGQAVGICSTDHCLSIQKMDPETHRLTILNPWGSDGDYKIEGTDIHVTMNKGFFEMPFGEACHAFENINVPLNCAPKES